jgi:hypothetical protein
MPNPNHPCIVIPGIHPGLQNTVVNQNGVPLDIFDIHNWQSTVTPDPSFSLPGANERLTASAAIRSDLDPIAGVSP